MVVTGSALALAAIAWFLTPAFVGDREAAHTAVVACGLIIWLLTVITLLPVGLVGSRGVMPTVYAWFGGMAVRLPAALVASIAMQRFYELPVNAVFASLAVYYLPLVMIEAGLVGRYLWRKDALKGGSEPANDASQSSEVTA